MNYSKIGLISLSVLLFTGCFRLEPELKKPDTTQYKTESIKYESSKWWEKLNNDELNQLIIKAQENNTDIKIAELVQKIAQKNLEEIEYSILPTITGSTAVNNQQTEEKLLRTWSAGLSVLSYEIDYLNKRKTEEKMYAAGVEIKKLELEVLKDLIAYSVASEYYKAKNYTNIAIMLDKKIENLDAIIDVYSQRVSVGLENEYMLTDYKIQKRVVEADRNNIAQQKELAIKNLRALLNDSSFQLQEELKDVDFNYAKFFQNVPSSVLENRLDIKIAENDLIVKNGNIGLAKANFFPKISLTTALGLQSKNLSEITSSSTVWQVRPEITYNIFNGMSDLIVYENSKTELEKSLINYSTTVRNAFIDISFYIKALELSQQNKLKKEESLELAYKKLSIIKQKSDIGILSKKDALIEENSLINAHIEKEKSINEFLNATILLMHSAV